MQVILHGRGKPLPYKLFSRHGASFTLLFFLKKYDIISVESISGVGT